MGSTGLTRRRCRLAARALAGAWAAFVAGLLLWSLLPVLAGWTPTVVLSGSMRPTLVPGDVVLIGPVPRGQALPAGRVIAVRDPHLPSGSYLHRLVGYDDNGGMITRGDANPTPDHPVVARDRVIGQARLVVRGIGLPHLWLHTGRLWPLAGCIAATALAVLSLAGPPSRRAAAPAPARALTGRRGYGSHFRSGSAGVGSVDQGATWGVPSTTHPETAISDQLSEPNRQT